MTRLLTLLLLGCATTPERTGNEVIRYEGGSQVSTKLVPPDAGPFDFAPPPEPPPHKATTDVDHAGQLPGTFGR